MIWPFPLHLSRTLCCSAHGHAHAGEKQAAASGTREADGTSYAEDVTEARLGITGAAEGQSVLLAFRMDDWCCICSLDNFYSLKANYTTSTLRLIEQLLDDVSGRHAL